MIFNLLNLLYPNKCPYCGKTIDNSLEACKDCYSNLPFIFEDKKLKVLDNKEILCISTFKYQTCVKKAIINYKFYSKVSFACAFSNSLHKCFKNKLGNLKFDVITAIPLSKKAKKKRGFNQAELIAKKLARKLNVKYSNILEKYKDNRPQHNLNIEERKENVAGIYKIKKGIDIKNKKILLIDDIVTTGNTLKEASKIILNGGALDITCLTLAFTEYKR